VIPVTVPCSCPGKPHTEDTVYLPPVADVPIGMAMMSAMRWAPARVPEMEAAIAGALIHVAPREWTFVDDKGEPLELTPENIDARLTWGQGGAEVAEAANELYGGDGNEAVFSPLVQKRLKASRRSRMGSSTSQTPTPGSTTDSSDKPSLRTVSGGRRSGAKAS
jgi:hypothetical protein